MIRKLKIIVATFAVGIIGLMILINSPLNPAERQRRNLALAAGHIQAHAAIVGRDPRFRLIMVQIDTEQEGGILLTGYVASEEDLKELEAAWARTRPPVPSSFGITVLPEPYFSGMSPVREPQPPGRGGVAGPSPP
jgi:hypothetical protein